MENDAKLENPVKISGLTRREFLKYLISIFGIGSLFTIFGEAYKYSLADLVMTTKALVNPPTTEFEGKQKELKDHYDEALLVVHPGFGALRFGKKYSGNEKYEEYLARLQETINKARSENKLIVFMFGAEEMRAGNFEERFKPSDADFLVVTASDNPDPVGIVQTTDGKLHKQSFWVVNEIMKAKGVRNVQIAGEFKNACVSLTKSLFYKKDAPAIKINDDAVY